MKKVILTLVLGAAVALPGMLSAQDNSASINKESRKGTGTSVTTKKEGTAEPLKAKGTGIVYQSRSVHIGSEGVRTIAFRWAQIFISLSSSACCAGKLEWATVSFPVEFPDQYRDATPFKPRVKTISG